MTDPTTPVNKAANCESTAPSSVASTSNVTPRALKNSTPGAPVKRKRNLLGNSTPASPSAIDNSGGSTSPTWERPATTNKRPVRRRLFDSASPSTSNENLSSATNEQKTSAEEQQVPLQPVSSLQTLDDTLPVSVAPDTTISEGFFVGTLQKKRIAETNTSRGV